MLTLYGHPMSRAHRNMWMLRETGVKYEHVPTGFLDGGTKQAAFLAINPNGKVPVLQDGDLVLCESLAINLHLARQYPSAVSPATPVQAALTDQWTLWVANEIEKTLLVACKNVKLFAEPSRRPVEARMAMDKLDRPFKVLDAHVSRQDWLVGGRFTVADINVASVMTLIPICGIDISAYPHLAAWLARCLARPAADDYKTIDFKIPRPPTEAGWLQQLM